MTFCIPLFLLYFSFCIPQFKIQIFCISYFQRMNKKYTPNKKLLKCYWRQTCALYMLFLMGKNIYLLVKSLSTIFFLYICPLLFLYFNFFFFHICPLLFSLSSIIFLLQFMLFVYFIQFQILLATSSLIHHLINSLSFFSSISHLSPLPNTERKKKIKEK